LLLNQLVSVALRFQFLFLTLLPGERTHTFFCANWELTHNYCARAELVARCLEKRAGNQAADPHEYGWIEQYNAAEQA
jgi:hypothetical protein